MLRALTVFLNDGTTLRWNLDFSERGTVRVPEDGERAVLSWTALGHHQCLVCPLDAKETEVCPVADVLGEYAMDLADYPSSEKGTVHILEDGGRRIILEEVPLQTVAGELVRLAVFQGGCPVGRQVKPAMARLRPFPSDRDFLEAMALHFAFRKRNNEESGGDFSEHEKVMQSLHDLFGCLSKRLENQGEGDVCINAVVIMHSLSLFFSLSAPALIKRAMEEFGV